MKRKITLALILMATACSRPTGLLTSYMENPMGIDGTPTFSWQSPSAQSAYQIQVADAYGRQIWDSGKLTESHSVQMPYGGKLLPETAYTWRVRCWDQNGRGSGWSDAASFETGMDGWEGAQWIGSEKYTLSKYKSNFFINCLLCLADGSENLVLVLGARDEENYVGIELGHKELCLYHVRDGKRTDDARENVSTLIRPQGPQELEAEVYASQYCRKYNINLTLNGTAVQNTHRVASGESDPLKKYLAAGNNGGFMLDLAREDEQFFESRLYAVGFDGKGKVSGLTIRDRAWGTVLYKDDNEREVDGFSIFSPGEEVSAPVLRKNFNSGRKPVKARLYASAKGIYDCVINGRPVTDSYYNPGWSEYRKRMFYNVFDVTDLVRDGDNDIQVTLGQGWWSGYVGYEPSWQEQYGLRQEFIAKLSLEYSDGTRASIVTDGSWEKSDGGPVTENSFQNGEEYDSGKAAENWESVIAHVPEDDVIFQPYPGELIRCHEERKALAVTNPRPEVFIYDMGADIAGVPVIDLELAAGQKITLRYGEMLWPEKLPSNPTAPYTREMYEANKGTLYTDNYRSALSTDTFIGDGTPHTYEPKLTQHGFRYIQVEGLTEALPLGSVRAKVLHGMPYKRTAELETSNPLINKLFDNIVRGQEGNFLAVPTDCPQRDERLGYTGDGQVFAMAASYNYNVDAFYRRWLYSVRDGQLPSGSFPGFSPDLGTPRDTARSDGNIGWSDAGILIPWYMYRQYADKEILEISWKSMKRYMDHLESLAEGYILPFRGLGDWLAFERTNQQIVHSSFFALDARAMAGICAALGKDPSHYEELYAHIKEAFNAAFVGEDGRTVIRKGYDNGYLIFSSPVTEDTIEDTQGSYVLPLAAGLFEDPRKAADRLAEKIRENGNKLSTGFLSTPYLCGVLTDYGHADTAYDLLLQTDCPSWLYPVTQGATTIWERWNSYTSEHGFGPVDMNSFNHYSYGAVESWMMDSMLGIKAVEPGYKSFRLDPHPSARLDYARGHFDSVYGRIEAGWKKSGEGFEYTVSVPRGASAEFNGRTLGPGKHVLHIQ